MTRRRVDLESSLRQTANVDPRNDATERKMILFLVIKTKYFSGFTTEMQRSANVAHRFVMEQYW